MSTNSNIIANNSFNEKRYNKALFVTCLIFFTIGYIHKSGSNHQIQAFLAPYNLDKFFFVFISAIIPFIASIFTLFLLSYSFLYLSQIALISTATISLIQIFINFSSPQLNNIIFILSSSMFEIIYGILFALILLWIKEISPTKVSGASIIFVLFSGYCGDCLYLVLQNNKTYKKEYDIYMNIFISLPLIISILGFIVLKLWSIESFKYLHSRKPKIEVIKNLENLYRDSKKAEEEYNYMNKDLYDKEYNDWNFILNNDNFAKFKYALIVMLGNCAIHVYLYLSQEFGSKDLDPSIIKFGKFSTFGWISIISNLAFFIPPILYIDRFGRKCVCLFGIFLMILFALIMLLNLLITFIFIPEAINDMNSLAFFGVEFSLIGIISGHAISTETIAYVILLEFLSGKSFCILICIYRLSIVLYAYPFTYIILDMLNNKNGTLVFILSSLLVSISIIINILLFYLILVKIPETCQLHDFEINKLFKVFRSRNNPNLIDNNDYGKLGSLDKNSNLEIINKEKDIVNNYLKENKIENNNSH